ncbi:hypothetical protein CRUP_000633, partial [Coryphaenoides rupestris]
ELCLNIIPTFANLIDYPSMKNSLIPRIKSACLQTSSLALIPSREPAVLMGVLGIYKCTFTHKKLGIPKEHLASKSMVISTSGNQSEESNAAPGSSHHHQDLTSSLFQNKTSLGGLSLANTPRPGPAAATTTTAMSAFPGPMMGTMGTPMSNGFNPAMGFQAAGLGRGMGPSLYGGMATASSTPNFGSLAQHPGGLGQTNRTPNMAALDNLFTSNKPKATLHQLGSNTGSSGGPHGQQRPWHNQFGPGQANQTAPAPGFGMQANPFFNPQNFLSPPLPPASTQWP